MPGLTTSDSRITPSTRAPVPSAPAAEATTSGVPPSSEIASTMRSTSTRRAPSFVSGGAATTSAGDTAAQARTAVAAPLRTTRPPRSTPDIRVCAVNGTNPATASVASASAGRPWSAAQSATTLRPSGVRSARLDSRAAAARSAADVPPTGISSVARRLPNVIVPVLSSSSVSTSPAASTARPEVASTLRCTSRSMPAMPIADSSAPIVVGIRQTSSAVSTISGTCAPA